MHLLLSVCLVLAQSQQKMYEEYKVSVHQIHVNVTDRSGNPIRDLDSEDFIIELNGQPQTVESVIPISLLRDVLEQGAENEAPVGIPENGRRLFIFLFDLQYNSRRGLLKARESARAFVENDLLETDLAAVFTIAGQSTYMAVNFTNDVPQLLHAINNLGFIDRKHRSEYASGFVPPDELKQMTGDAFSRDDELADLGSMLSLVGDELARDLGPTQEALARRDSGINMRFLKGFRDFGESLSILQGRKNLIFFSEGFADYSGLVLRYQRELIEQLQGAGTVVFSIDTSTQGTAATKPNADVLNNIAATSGGRLFTNYNRFDKPLARIESATSDYYLVNIRTDLDLPRGELARLKVGVRRAGAKIFAPKGLLINPDYENANPLERKLLLSQFISKDQIALPIPISTMVRQIPSEDRIRLNVITEIDGEYFLDHALSGQEMEFEVFSIAINKRTNQLSDQEFQSFRLKPKLSEGKTRPVSVKYFTDLNLDPGSYKVKTLVRNVKNGLISCLIKDVDLFSPTLPVAEPLFVNQEPSVVFRHVTRVANREVQAEERYPYELGGTRFTPNLNPVLDVQGQARVLHLLHKGQLEGRKNRVVVTVKIADSRGTIINLPADALKSRVAPDTEEPFTLLLTNIDFSKLGLKVGESYQLLTSVKVAGDEAVQGTALFETRAEGGIPEN